MSKRRNIARKLERYDDVRSMLSAMKNLALMEVHKLGQSLDRQKQVLGTVERVAADFSSFYDLPLEQAGGITIVIGAERGFCGEFNAELVAPALEAQERGEKILVVGNRLADRLEEEGRVESLAGAVVAEEIPQVLERVAGWLEHTQQACPGLSSTVKVLYQDEAEGGPHLKTVAPLPVPDRPATVPSHKPLLNLTAPDFTALLGEQALLLSLEGTFMMSLATENRRRLEHMEKALHRLEETTRDLTQRMNMARQGEIIQEIETIMLGAEAL
ncbi:F0F1 ATP synthase subunit gamma [Emcibacter nanhaiensis]|uniref:F0F1 ATP synthase subunit gamma n=1 Tax=Emcibacter nanhaiensis TaxID=1505037 RepID=A0A501PH90_9PROT|nr:F0F1 ATP synthase subunit gamma [Emcibacter nanhaiensis]TPD59833.1 hypothetical protein FIV46_10120 [Emcibacter nanhaiensis]